MYWETLPTWVWSIYYLFLLATMGTAIYSMIRKKLIGLSIIAMILTISIPFISFLNSIERAAGLNEFEYLILQLQQGAIWSVYTMVGYLYLFVWWGMFLIKKI